MFGGKFMEQNATKSEKSIERVYQYVKQYIHENAMSPSVRDICTGANLKSTSSVHSYLKKLHDMGRIEYRPGMRRAIIIKNNDYSEEATVESSSAEVTNLPVIGKITAGIPILAHEDYSESVPVSKTLIGNDECFMLRVSGNSMINAHILDGDLIIVRKQNYCDEGDIIAALIEEEATVKRFGKMNGTPYLFPENEMYSPIPFNNENCKIIGKVIGLHRYSIS